MVRCDAQSAGDTIPGGVYFGRNIILSLQMNVGFNPPFRKEWHNLNISKEEKERK